MSKGDIILDKYIKLRKAEMKDLNVIVSIYNKAIEVMNQNEIMQWDSIYPNRVVLKEDILNGEMLLGEIDNSIVSIAVINKECDEEYETANWKYKDLSYCVIHRLCVNPNFQNRGIGTKTMLLIESLCRTRGFETVRLDAFSLNPYALKMYEKLGYVRVGEATWRKGLFYLYEKSI